jgi:hypothetical protein
MQKQKDGTKTSVMATASLRTVTCAASTRKKRSKALPCLLIPAVVVRPWILPSELQGFCHQEKVRCLGATITSSHDLSPPVWSYPRALHPIGVKRHFIV